MIGGSHPIARFPGGLKAVNLLAELPRLPVVVIAGLDSLVGSVSLLAIGHNLELVLGPLRRVIGLALWLPIIVAALGGFGLYL